MITINDAGFDTESLQQEFAQQGIVRIHDFLTTDSIELLANYATSQIEYSNAFFLDGQNREATDDDIARLSVEQRRELYQGIYKLASQGTGFLYGRNKVSLSSPEPLSTILNLLNNVSTVDLIKSITNIPSITYADAQITRYRVGDFLTRHVDNIAGESRKIAYVLGMSPTWHPDWGGLLQFFEKDGTPTKSWLPVYNSLTIFDVEKVHSVTSVAPFSPQSRYSVTGWYRS